MNNSNDSLKWTISIVYMIGWWIFCGICLYLDIFPMTPIVCCVAIVIGVILAFAIKVAITIKEKIDAKKKIKKIERRIIADRKFEELKKKYPNAAAYFFEKGYYCPEYNKAKYKEYFEILEAIYAYKEKAITEHEKYIKEKEEEEYLFNKKIQELKTHYMNGIAIWKEKNKEKYHPDRKPNEPWMSYWEDEDKRPFVTDTVIVENEQKIKEYEGYYKKAIVYNEWQKEQNAFSTLCWKTAHDSFPNLGRYNYSISLPSYDKNYESTTKECIVWQIFTKSFCADNNIEYTYYKYVHDNFIKTKSLGDKFIFENAQKIVDFIKTLNKEASVILNIDRNTLFDETAENFTLAASMISELSDTNCEIIFKDESPTKKYIIIVEAVTSNTELKNKCEEIISKYSSLTPCLCYLSLMKGFDTDEMQALIDKKEESEREKKKIEAAHKMIVEAVRNWDTIFMGFHAISMLDYYPTTLKVIETSEMWNDRRMVWNFKNDPEKVYKTENTKAMKWTILQAKEIIETTFGKENAQYITFVCIPASSQEMSERRYKAFAEKLCKATGMIDSFNYIKVTHAKAEVHTGGKSFSQDMLEYDPNFFKGKYVLLFDDIITTGSSMKSFKAKLQELGSIVIGGMSIGRSKKEHVERVTLESLGIKLIPKPQFSMRSKLQSHKSGIPNESLEKNSKQKDKTKGLCVEYNKAPIYNDMPLNTYPAIRFPEKGCIVFPYRTGKQFRRGYTEQLFEDFIKSHLPNSFSIIGNAKILLGDECRPYEPDIAIIASSNRNIRIDIEIDEPYNGVTREPTHFIGCGDEFRDLNIINAGWIVMRFTEEQIFCEKEKCLNEIYRLLWSLDSNYVFEILDFDRNIHLGIKPFWTELDAKMMAATNFRENYLQHNFGNEEVALSKQEYLKQTEEEKVIAKQIKCIPQLRAQNQNNIDNTKLSFVQDKDIEFFAKEHIYVYKKFIQLKAVSDVISMFFRKFDSISWSRKKALGNGISQRCQLEQWDCKGAESREVGTYLHEQIHKHFIKEDPDFIYHFLYNGEEVHVDKIVDISTEYTYFKKFLNEENIIPFRTEWQIFDPVLRIAGTIDFLSRNDSDFDLYDWKRSDKIDRNATVWNYGINGLESVPDTRYYHYCLQLNMYKYILEKNYNIAINKMYLVVLHPVYNTYQKIEVPTMTNVVNSIIGYYQTIA